MYILTVKEKDGENDSSSKLNRKNVYRVNLGVYKDTFKEMFDIIPKRPAVYRWMGWICVLNPSEKTFEKLKPLIQQAYEYAKKKYNKRKA